MKKEHEDSNNEADENQIIPVSPKTHHRLLREKIGQCNYD